MIMKHILAKTALALLATAVPVTASAQAALEGRWKNPKGSVIVVTASLAGLTAIADDPIYGLTKHAVVGFVRSVAPQLAERAHHGHETEGSRHIRVTSISGGLCNVWRTTQ